jgi:hypothetical protein
MQAPGRSPVGRPDLTQPQAANHALSREVAIGSGAIFGVGDIPALAACHLEPAPEIESLLRPSRVHALLELWASWPCLAQTGSDLRGWRNDQRLDLTESTVDRLLVRSSRLRHATFAFCRSLIT